MNNTAMRIAAISFIIFLIGIVLVMIPELNTYSFSLVGLKMTVPLLIMASGAFIMIGVMCGIPMIAVLAYMIFPERFKEVME